MDNAIIYYFSGTGNSLAIARDIANKINGEVIPVAALMENEHLKPNTNLIGIIFPIYFAWFGGVPSIIKRFVEKLEDLSQKYIFAVCSYGNGTGPAMEILGDLIKSRGGKLCAGFSVNMPYNYVMGSRLQMVHIEKQQSMISSWHSKLESIYECINSKRKNVFETNASSTKGMLGIILKMIKNSKILKKSYKSHLQRQAGIEGKTDMPFEKIVPLMDRSFKCDERCNGCGICEKICPVKNIKMQNRMPSWTHHCEQCFACLQWCPQRAIHFGLKTEGERYHHPDIKLSDLLNHAGK